MCTASPRLHIVFNEDGSGGISGMEVHEIVIMARTADATEAEVTRVPEEFQPFLGTYHLAALKADFRVSYKKSGLVVFDPMRKEEIGLQPPDPEGWRLDEFGKNSIQFQTGDGGAVIGLKVDSVSRLLLQ